MDTTVHEIFFRKALAHPQRSAHFLRTVMPSDVVETIDLDAIAQVPDAQIGAALNRRLVDVVFKIPIINGDGLYIICYFKIKSEPDDSVYLQIAECETLLFRAMDDKMVSQFAVIFYHGKQPWDIPLHRIDLLPPEARSRLEPIFGSRQRNRLPINLNAPDGSAQQFDIDNLSIGTMPD